MNMSNKDKSLLARQSLAHDLLRLLIIALAYWASRQIAFQFPSSKGVVMAVWPASGVGLAAFLISPLRLWPAISITLFAVGLMSNLLYGRTVFSSVGFMVADVIESLSCAWLMITWCKTKIIRFARTREIVSLVFAVMLVMFIAAGIAALVESPPDIVSLVKFWLEWSVSSGLGSLIIAPLIVAWSHPVDAFKKVQAKRWFEFILLALMVFGLSSIALNVSSASTIFHPRPYILLGLVAWAALRFGMRGVTFTITVFAVVGISASQNMSTPLLWGGVSPAQRLIHMQAFIAFTAVLGYLLAASYHQAKSAEHDARANEEWFRNLMHTSFEGLIVHDQGVVLDVNQAMLNLFGLKKANEIVGKMGPDIFPITEESKNIIRSHSRSETNEPYEIIIKHADGGIRYAETRGRDIRYRGRIVRVVTMRDITEQKTAGEELRKRSHQLAELASELTMAEHRQRRLLAERLHDDLQQLLVGARIQGELLRSRVDKHNEQPMDVLLSTLSDAMESSRRITQEMAIPVFHHEDLVSAIQWLASDMQKKYHLAITVTAGEIPPDIPEAAMILVYTTSRELLLNIVKHAQIKEVVLSLKCSEDGLVLEIMDKGCGFNPAMIREKSETHGLGLFSIRERTLFLGGTFTIDSKPGHGTHITQTIPLTVPLTMKQEEGDGHVHVPHLDRLARHMKDVPSPAQGDVIRLVLVDDHHTVREALITLLKAQHDFEIIAQADNGKQAIECVERCRPNVVLMDVNMPVMDGVEATRIMKQKWPNIAVLGLSMFEGTDVAEKMREAGADDYLFKSGSPEKLVKAIRESAAKYHRR